MGMLNYNSVIDKCDKFLQKTARYWPDKLYLSLLFRLRGGYKINFNNPQTFNEKLNWLKLYDNNPLYSQLADKYGAKLYVKSIIGENHVAECYGVWNDANDINFDELPDQFVLKCTHDSGSRIICKNKSLLDISTVINNLNQGLKKEYYYKSREWPYKNITPKIIAEQFLDDHNGGNELRDYKFWCFNGEPKVVYLTNKGADIYENFYDMDFKPLDVNHGFHRHAPEFKEPDNFQEMKKLATQLSKDLPFVRVDFFDVDGNIYFAEFTFYDWGGMRPFTDYNWDLKLGQWLRLPEKKQ